MPEKSWTTRAVNDFLLVVIVMIESLFDEEALFIYKKAPVKIQGR
jgi:hypothetical protein